MPSTTSASSGDLAALAAGALWPLLAALDADAAAPTTAAFSRAARPLAEVVRRLGGVPTLALQPAAAAGGRGGGAAARRAVEPLPIASVVASNTRDSDHGAAQVLLPGTGCWVSALGRVGSLTATLQLPGCGGGAVAAAEVAGLIIDLPPDMLPERVEVELGVTKRPSGVSAAAADAAPLPAGTPTPAVGGKRELGGGSKQPSPPPAQPPQTLPGLASLRADLGIAPAGGGAASGRASVFSAAGGSAASGSAGSFTSALQSPRGSSAAASAASPPSPASATTPSKPAEVHWYPAARLPSSAVSPHMVVTALSPAPAAALAAGGIVIPAGGTDGGGDGGAAYATHVKLTLTGHASSNSSKAVGVARLQVLGRQPKPTAAAAALKSDDTSPASLAALLSDRAVAAGYGDEDGAGSSGDVLARVVAWVGRLHDAATAAVARRPQHRRLARIQAAVRAGGAGASDALAAALAPQDVAAPAAAPACPALDAFTAVACTLGCRLAATLPPGGGDATSAGARDAGAAYTLPPRAVGGEKGGDDDEPLLRALHTLAAQLHLQLHVDAAGSVVTATAPQATAAAGSAAAAALAKLLGVSASTAGAAAAVAAPQAATVAVDDDADAYLSDSGSSGDDDAATTERRASAATTVAAPAVAATDVALTALAGLLHAVRATGSAAGLMGLAASLLAKPPLPVAAASPARAAGAALLHAMRQRSLALRRAVGAAEYAEDARGRGQAPPAGPSYGPIPGAAFDAGLSSAGVKVGVDGRTVASVSGSHSHAIVRAGPFTSGRAAWEFKLEEDTHSQCSCFGAATLPVDSSNYECSRSLWMLRAYNGNRYARGGAVYSGVSDGDKVRKGDRVRFELDFDDGDGVLRLWINDVPKGVAFTGLRGLALYPAVAFYSGGRTVSLQWVEGPRAGNGGTGSGGDSASGAVLAALSPSTPSARLGAPVARYLCGLPEDHTLVAPGCSLGRGGALGFKPSHAPKASATSSAATTAAAAAALSVRVGGLLFPHALSMRPASAAAAAGAATPLLSPLALGYPSDEEEEDAFGDAGGDDDDDVDGGGSGEEASEQEDSKRPDSDDEPQPGVAAAAAAPPTGPSADMHHVTAAGTVATDAPSRRAALLAAARAETAALLRANPRAATAVFWLGGHAESLAGAVALNDSFVNDLTAALAAQRGSASLATPLAVQWEVVGDGQRLWASAPVPLTVPSGAGSGPKAANPLQPQPFLVNLLRVNVLRLTVRAVPRAEVAASAPAPAVGGDDSAAPPPPLSLSPAADAATASVATAAHAVWLDPVLTLATQWTCHGWRNDAGAETCAVCGCRRGEPGALVPPGGRGTSAPLDSTHTLAAALLSEAGALAVDTLRSLRTAEAGVPPSTSTALSAAGGSKTVAPSPWCIDAPAASQLPSSWPALAASVALLERLGGIAAGSSSSSSVATHGDDDAVSLAPGVLRACASAALQVAAVNVRAMVAAGAPTDVAAAAAGGSALASPLPRLLRAMLWLGTWGGAAEGQRLVDPKSLAEITADVAAVFAPARAAAGPAPPSASPLRWSTPTTTPSKGAQPLPQFSLGAGLTGSGSHHHHHGASASAAAAHPLARRRSRSATQEPPYLQRADSDGGSAAGGGVGSSDVSSGMDSASRPPKPQPPPLLGGSGSKRSVHKIRRLVSHPGGSSGSGGSRAAAAAASPGSGDAAVPSPAAVTFAPDSDLLPMSAFPRSSSAPAARSRTPSESSYNTPTSREGSRPPSPTSAPAPATPQPPQPPQFSFDPVAAKPMAGGGKSGSAAAPQVPPASPSVAAIPSFRALDFAPAASSPGSAALSAAAGGSPVPVFAVPAAAFAGSPPAAAGVPVFGGGRTSPLTLSQQPGSPPTAPAAPLFPTRARPLDFSPGKSGALSPASPNDGVALDGAAAAAPSLQVRLAAAVERWLVASASGDGAVAADEQAAKQLLALLRSSAAVDAAQPGAAAFGSRAPPPKLDTVAPSPPAEAAAQQLRGDGAFQDALWTHAASLCLRALLPAAGDRSSRLAAALTGPAVFELDFEWPRSDESRVYAAAAAAPAAAATVSPTAAGSGSSAAGNSDAAVPPPPSAALTGQVETLLLLAQLHARAAGWRHKLLGAWPARVSLVVEVPLYPGGHAFATVVLPELMEAAGFAGWALPDGLHNAAPPAAQPPAPAAPPPASSSSAKASAAAAAAAAPAQSAGLTPAVASAARCHVPFVLERAPGFDRRARLAVEPVGQSVLAGAVRAYPAAVADFGAVVTAAQALLRPSAVAAKR